VSNTPFEIVFVAPPPRGASVAENDPRALSPPGAPGASMVIMQSCAA